MWIKGQIGWVLGGSGESRRVNGEWLVVWWIRKSFQKIFGFYYGQERHTVDWIGVTIVTTDEM